ncbi:MAG: hypothetical protein QNJ78_04260 [Gammaproteobacteria bacterium]|nr:hypothetical protein [Gammaproteobacteria bacterium]
MTTQKSTLLKILFATAILFTAQSTYAAFFGWQTTVKAVEFNGVSLIPHSTPVSGPTYWACENARNIAINNYTALGYWITSAPGCTAIPFRIPEWIEWPEIRWPWPGPVCLSCPFLTEESITVIYPNNVKQVTELMQRYNIDVYNAQLRQLQQKFDLERFEEEMFQLELKQKLGSVKEMFKR